MREKVIQIQEFSSAVLLVLMSIFVFLQVISRFAIKIPFGWTEELSKIFLIWLTYVALAPTFSRNIHVRIDMLDQYLTKKGELILKITNHVIGIIFGIFSLYYILILYQSQLEYGQLTPVLSLPMTVVLIPLVAGVFITTLYFLFETWQLFRQARKT